MRPSKLELLPHRSQTATDSRSSDFAIGLPEKLNHLRWLSNRSGPLNCGLDVLPDFRAGRVNFKETHKVAVDALWDIEH
jgi:hypothetical protein